jgi:hypothetical protein
MLNVTSQKFCADLVSSFNNYNNFCVFFFFANKSGFQTHSFVVEQIQWTKQMIIIEFKNSKKKLFNKRFESNCPRTSF